MVTDILLVCERCRGSPFTRSSIARLCGSADLVGRNDVRPQRTEGIDALAEAEDA